MRAVKKIFATAAFVAVTSFSITANATVFAVDYHDAGVWNAYDTENEAYAMKFRADQGKDGFWLVVTDGNNPKGDGSSHAILYGDFKNNRITAYAYDGRNSSESYQNGDLLGTFENAFTPGGIEPEFGYELTMFSLDVSEINGLLGDNFEGVSLGEKAGIWFHQSAGSNFEYDADGSIVQYTFDNQMFLDRGNDATWNAGAVDCTAGETSRLRYLSSCGSTQISNGSVGSSNGGTTNGGGSVPAPGGLALIFAGLAVISRKLRWKK